MTVYVLIYNGWIAPEVVGVFRRYQDADAMLHKKAANLVDVEYFNIEEQQVVE